MSETFKFKKIGGFDENFFFYWEDEDLLKRIQHFSNYQIYKCYSSYANHNNGNSTIKTNNTEYIRFSNFKFGEFYYQNKYKKLRLIKMIREPISRFCLILFCLVKLHISSAKLLESVK